MATRAPSKSTSKDAKKLDHERFKDMLITIPSWHEQGKQIYFDVHVKTRTNEWDLPRRFDQFQWVDNEIKKDGIRKTPPLPKSKLFGARDRKTLDDRRILLKNYLQKLVRPENVAMSPTLQRWLEMDETGRNVEAPNKSGMNQRAIAVARALYDFSSEDDKCLTFSKGAIISLVDKSNPEWWKGKFNGRAGVFPAAYVTIIAEMSAQAPPPTESISSQPAPPKPDPSLNVRAIGAVRAIADYTGGDGELTFKAGDLIAVTAMHDDSPWSEGKCHGKAGWYPTDFAETLEHLKKPVSAVPKASIPIAAVHKTKTVRALFDYPAEGDNELDMTEGDILKVTDESDPDWIECQSPSGAIGFVPRSYVEDMSGDAVAAAAAPLPAAPSAGRTLKVLFDFDAEADDQISLREGDSVTVTDESDPEWFFGTSAGKSGFFPASYVGDGDDAAAQDLRQVRALYDRPAENADELTIQEGDMLTVERDEGDGWLFGCNDRGERGVFPEAYTE